VRTLGAVQMALMSGVLTQWLTDRRARRPPEEIVAGIRAISRPPGHASASMTRVSVEQLRQHLGAGRSPRMKLASPAPPRHHVLVQVRAMPGAGDRALVHPRLKPCGLLVLRTTRIAGAGERGQLGRLRPRCSSV
jgi:hypothetical protein